MEPIKELERPTKIKARDDGQTLNVMTRLIKVTGGKVHSLQNEGQLTVERRQVDPQFYFIYLFIFLGGQKKDRRRRNRYQINFNAENECHRDTNTNSF